MTKYSISDATLAKLCLLISVPDIKDRFPEYTPSVRTMYRRLEALGITKPYNAYKDFRKSIIGYLPYVLPYQEALQETELVIQEILEETATSIEKEAIAFNERFGA